MQLFNSLLLLAATAVASAKPKVTFVNQDGIPRTVFFTPSVPHAQLPDFHVGAGETRTMDFPSHWIGQWWAKPQGQPRLMEGMLGEVSFEAHEGKTFFDVSAIVNPTDWHNVKMLYPAVSHQPTSGCDDFPCDNVYWLPNDEQTKVTPENHLICTLGDRPQDRKAPKASRRRRSKGRLTE